MSMLLYELERRSSLALGMGLSGAHRTGKTTIAKMVSEKNSVPLVTSFSSAIAADMGIDITKPMTFATRLAFQEAILFSYMALYRQQTGWFIADRTPMDLAAYLIASIPHDLGDAELIMRSRLYVENCFAASNKYFGLTVLIQPGIPYVSEPGKPLPNQAYQEAINTIILGLMYDDRLKNEIDVFDRRLTDQIDRAEAFADRISAALDAFSRESRELPAC